MDKCVELWTIIFQNLDADPSDFADTTRTVPDSVDAFTDPIRIERIDTHGPSVASAESVFVFCELDIR